MTDALDTCRLCTRPAEVLHDRGGTRMCRSCMNLLWFADVLMDSDATEAEIVPTLAFAPHAKSLWRIVDPAKRTAEVHRLLASYPALDLAEFVGGVPVLRMRDALAEAVRYPNSKLTRSVQVRVLSRFARPDAMAALYAEVCEDEDLPVHGSSAGSISWGWDNMHLRARVGPLEEGRLDPAKYYGLWWFNRRKMTSRQVSEASEGGRRYGRKYSSHIKPKEEWIAVPVPDSGIPREVVDAARAAIEYNRVPSSAGDRFWQLSGGVARCGECGRRMRVVCRTKRPKKKPPRRYGYYRCAARQEHGEEACPNGRMVSAAELEAKVWDFVRGVMTEPQELAADLDRMIELKRSDMRGDPVKEAKAWTDELAKLERMSDGYHDQAAEGLLGFDKLREKLAALDERRATAERELEGLKGHGEELERLERDRETVVSHYAALATEVLELMDPEERHRLYGILGIKVFAKDGEAWVEMPIRPPAPLEEEESVYRNGVTSPSARTGVPS